VALGGGQILVAQTEPATAAGEYAPGDFQERAARLGSVGDDEERRVRQPAAAHGCFAPKRMSALTVTRTVASPGAATGAGIGAAAVAAKRNIGMPPVSALPTVRSR